jgi:hypothetical protein
MDNIMLTGRIYQCFWGKSTELMRGFGGGAPKKLPYSSIIYGKKTAGM